MKYQTDEISYQGSHRISSIEQGRSIAPERRQISSNSIDKTIRPLDSARKASNIIDRTIRSLDSARKASNIIDGVIGSLASARLVVNSMDNSFDSLYSQNDSRHIKCHWTAQCTCPRNRCSVVHVIAHLNIRWHFTWLFHSNWFVGLFWFVCVVSWWRHILQTYDHLTHHQQL